MSKSSGKKPPTGPTNNETTVYKPFATASSGKITMTDTGGLPTFTIRGTVEDLVKFSENLDKSTLDKLDFKSRQHKDIPNSKDTSVSIVLKDNFTAQDILNIQQAAQKSSISFSDVRPKTPPMAVPTQKPVQQQATQQQASASKAPLKPVYRLTLEFPNEQQRNAFFRSSLPPSKDYLACDPIIMGNNVTYAFSTAKERKGYCGRTENRFQYEFEGINGKYPTLAGVTMAGGSPEEAGLYIVKADLTPKTKGALILNNVVSTQLDLNQHSLSGDTTTSYLFTRSPEKVGPILDTIKKSDPSAKPVCLNESSEVSKGKENHKRNLSQDTEATTIEKPSKTPKMEEHKHAKDKSGGIRLP